MSCHKCGKLGHFERECRSGISKTPKAGEALSSGRSAICAVP